MTLKEMHKAYLQHEKEFNALTKHEQEKRIKSITGWALRIESENEVLEAQVKRDKAQDDGVSG